MAAFRNSYRDLIAFRTERFNPVLIGGGAHMKAVLTCLEPGQFIPVHRPGVDMRLIALHVVSPPPTEQDREGEWQ